LVKFDNYFILICLLIVLILISYIVLLDILGFVFIRIITYIDYILSLIKFNYLKFKN